MDELGEITNQSAESGRVGVLGVCLMHGSVG